MVGQTLSQYQITEKLAGGGMGVVDWVEDAMLGRSFPVKFLPTYVSVHKQALDMPLATAAIVTGVGHWG